MSGLPPPKGGYLVVKMNDGRVFEAFQLVLVYSTGGKTAFNFRYRDEAGAEQEWRGSFALVKAIEADNY